MTPGSGSKIHALAARRLGLPPARCLVFEDAIAGIQAARAAGMKVIAITTSYSAAVVAEHKPDATRSFFARSSVPTTFALSHALMQGDPCASR